MHPHPCVLAGCPVGKSLYPVHMYLSVNTCSQGSPLVTGGKFAPVFRLRERHVGQWLLKEFLNSISSLSSIVE